jgi:hypothetical protein
MVNATMPEFVITAIVDVIYGGLKATTLMDWNIIEHGVALHDIAT